MAQMIYIVFDEDGFIYGVYEEFTDAEDRKGELQDADGTASDTFLIEEYPLNSDYDPVGE